MDWGFLTMGERKRIILSNYMIPDISPRKGGVYDNTIMQLEMVPYDKMLWVPPTLSKKLEMSRRDLFQIHANSDSMNPRYDEFKVVESVM